LNPTGGRRFSLLYTHPDWPWGPGPFSCTGYRGASWGWSGYVLCWLPRPGASDGVLWGELYLCVSELIRCVHKIAKSDY